MRMRRERWGIMHRSKEHVQDGEANRKVVKKSGINVVVFQREPAGKAA